MWRFNSSFSSLYKSISLYKPSHTRPVLTTSTIHSTSPFWSNTLQDQFIQQVQFIHVQFTLFTLQYRFNKSSSPFKPSSLLKSISLYLPISLYKSSSLYKYSPLYTSSTLHNSSSFGTPITLQAQFILQTKFTLQVHSL